MGYNSVVASYIYYIISLLHPRTKGFVLNTLMNYLLKIMMWILALKLSLKRQFKIQDDQVDSGNSIIKTLVTRLNINIIMNPNLSMTLSPKVGIV